MHHSSPHASHRHAVARSAASRPATAWCQQLQRALGEGWESLLLGELWRAARGLVEPAHPKLTSSFNHTSMQKQAAKSTFSLRAMPSAVRRARSLTRRPSRARLAFSHASTPTADSVWRDGRRRKAHRAGAFPAQLAVLHAPRPWRRCHSTTP